jgi:hypothetical protein
MAESFAWSCVMGSMEICQADQALGNKFSGEDGATRHKGSKRREKHRLQMDLDGAIVSRFGYRNLRIYLIAPTRSANRE